MPTKSGVDALCERRQAREERILQENLGEYAHMLSMCDAATSSMLVSLLSCGRESTSLSIETITSSAKKDMEQVNCAYDRMRDVLEIWRYAGNANKEVLEKMLSLRMGLLNSRFAEREKKRFARVTYVISQEYGIDSMIDAYYDGVPLEDIIA